MRTSWLVRKGKAIIRELNGVDAAAKFKGSNSWVNGFAKRQGFSQRRGTNHKNKSAEARLPKLWRFHKGVRNLLHCRSGIAEDQWSAKYGCYPSRTRFNVDQVPRAFDMEADTTWDSRGVKRCWVKKHLAGLDKRFCTLQVCICQEPNSQGKQPIKICVIFRSNSKGRVGASRSPRKSSTIEGLQSSGRRKHGLTVRPVWSGPRASSGAALLDQTRRFSSWTTWMVRPMKNSWST